MKNLILSYCKHLFAGASVLLLLALLLTACSSNGASASSSLNMVGRVRSDAPQAPLSQSTLGPQPCPGKANNLSYWDNIIRTSGDAKVESVSCAKFMTYPGLQALVLVRHHSTGSIQIARPLAWKSEDQCLQHRLDGPGTKQFNPRTRPLPRI